MAWYSRPRAELRISTSLAGLAAIGFSAAALPQPASRPMATADKVTEPAPRSRPRRDARRPVGAISEAVIVSFSRCCRLWRGEGTEVARRRPPPPSLRGAGRVGCKARKEFVGWPARGRSSRVAARINLLATGLREHGRNGPL